MTSGFHEVVEARQSRGLECAVWRRACGKANVEMNSRLGDGQPPGLKSADRAKRGIFFDGLPLGRGAPVQCWI